MQIVCKMDMRSIEEMIGNLRGMLNRVTTEAADELKQIAEAVMLESAVECPRKTWTLVDSGYVGEPVIAAGQVGVDLGYGGPADKMNPITGKMASTYMVPVHERLDLVHPVGKAKFLEDPVRRNERVLLERLGNRVRVTLTISRGG